MFKDLAILFNLQTKFTKVILLSILFVCNVYAYNKQHLDFVVQQIVAGKKVNANGCDLSGVDFTEFRNFKKNVFEKADFCNADISACNFQSFSLDSAKYNINTIFDNTIFNSENDLRGPSENMVFVAEKSKMHEDFNVLLFHEIYCYMNGMQMLREANPDLFEPLLENEK